MDSLRRQVCARTAALPPVLDEDAAEDLVQGAPMPLKEAGRGYAALGLSVYADDTGAPALGAASLHETVPATEEWLQVTRQDVRWTNPAPGCRGNRAPLRSCSWVSGSHRRQLSASWASTSPLGAPGSPGPRRLSSLSFPRRAASPRSCTRGMCGASSWPVWPAGRGSPRSIPRLPGHRLSALLGWLHLGAGSARRPP